MAKIDNETKSITNIDSEGYLALKEFDFNTVVSEEMDGLNTVFERIKMPSGGTTLFKMPGDDTDEPSFVKEFSAVILYHHPIRAYFKTKFTGATNPPDCGSLDAVKGYGEPGGDCRNCIYNDFNRVLLVPLTESTLFFGFVSHKTLDFLRFLYIS